MWTIFDTKDMAVIGAEIGHGRGLFFNGPQPGEEARESQCAMKGSDFQNPNLI
jgi:hypothetical protein